MFVKHLTCSFMLFMHCFCTTAQLTETFSDADFTNNPEWFADKTDNWIVNPNGFLQSQSFLANSNFWISTVNEMAIGAEWSFDVRLEFNPSSVNYMDFFLIASDTILNDPITTGYFVRIGNTEDEISLYRKDADGKLNKLIDGRNGLLNKSSNTIRLRVLRDSNSNWYLLSNTDNTRFNEEGRAFDNTYQTSRFFGCLIRQSSSGFFQKHFVDNIRITPFIPDGAPPKLQLGYASADSIVTLIFDEEVHSVSNQLTNKFQLGDLKIKPVTIRADVNKLMLTFPASFLSGQTYILYYYEIEDVWGNQSLIDSVPVTYHPPQSYEILITEIMADPAPAQHLPESEWIEIKNTGKRIVSLRGWKLKDANTVSEIFPDLLLFPDSILITCNKSDEPLLREFGSVVGLSGFPSLNNESDTLHIIDEDGQTIHIVPYEKSWYKNPIKAEGGWSLEMIDPENPCGGKQNWTASASSQGGTPGKSNAAKASNKDLLYPRLLRAYAPDPFNILLTFDESLQAPPASVPSNYELSGDVTSIDSAIALSPFYHRVILKLRTALETEKTYTIRAKNLRDCAGNEIGSYHSAPIALPQRAVKNDLVINEILFDPKSDGVDYVEIFNRSNKPIDLKTIFIAGRNSRGALEQITPLVKEDRLLFPGTYLLATANTEIVETQFENKNAAVFVTCIPFPSLPNESGTIVLTDQEGMIIDELNYHSDWHFPLLINSEGVALERIHPDDTTQKKENWISAAADAGFGTPGMQNSQYRKVFTVPGTIIIDPPVFSPDNNGTDDYLFVRYRFDKSGYVLNADVYDARGNSVYRLAKNLLCGTEGTMRWDGLDELKRPLATGPYLIRTEIFHPSGKVKRFINRVVLVRR